jgi:hypothetical protein
VLLGNHTVLNKNPGRALGGPTVSDSRSAWNKSGAMRNRFVDAYPAEASEPSGVRPPYSWLIAVTAAGMQTGANVSGSGTLVGAGAMGVNGASTLAGSGDLAATMQLVASAAAALAGSGDLTAAGVAFANGAVTMAGAGDLAGAVNALGWAIVEAAGSGTLTTTVFATGEMVAEITPYTELSPQNLAAAVWTEAVAGYDDGSTGAALNLLAAMATNKTVTDPSAGTITVYDTDGTTVLYVADLWQDAAGTTPYAGSGAERRDAFA